MKIKTVLIVIMIIFCFCLVETVNSKSVETIKFNTYGKKDISDKKTNDLTQYLNNIKDKENFKSFFEKIESKTYINIFDFDPIYFFTGLLAGSLTWVFSIFLGPIVGIFLGVYIGMDFGIAGSILGGLLGLLASPLIVIFWPIFIGLINYLTQCPYDG